MTHLRLSVLRGSGVLLILAILLSGALLQAQESVQPVILTVNTDNVSSAFIRWDEVPGAVRYEVFIRGFNKEWSTKKEGGKGGWYPADGTSLGVGWHNFSDLLPASWYNFRVRAIDANGSVSRVSRKFKEPVPPCWVWARLDATGARWPEEHTDDPFTPPPEWAHVENTINCE